MSKKRKAKFGLAFFARIASKALRNGNKDAKIAFRNLCSKHF